MFHESVCPQPLVTAQRSPATDAYFNDGPTRKLAEFFEAKGIIALKQEDRAEQWYEDWLAYQSTHRLYASILAPSRYSTVAAQFDLLRYTRFLEVFAYFSPAHGYSLQVSFLGFFSILMGSNEALKAEAVAALESGGLLAFGVSEKEHGSDLLGNEFTVTETAAGRFVASGRKYYIGNSNAASIISILARKEDRNSADRSRRAPFVLFAVRPAKTSAFRNIGKIHTLGVRSAFVGEFELSNHELPESDLIADGRQAWDAVFGTVTLGKFFLGFGSIGICERSLNEAVAHLTHRILYDKPVMQMPHIRSAMSQAYARLTAMKLYAYRALDYIGAASADDRRYLLYCAVQKARTSTQGVKVMSLLSECIGAKGFESDTYFEMALRDIQLIPGLEGSAHINLALAAQFIPQYFSEDAPVLPAPKSLIAAKSPVSENPYLMEARSTAINSIGFPHFLKAYAVSISIPNVRLFAKQAKALQLFIQRHDLSRSAEGNTPTDLALGQCVATIAYGQLIAENAGCLEVPQQLVTAIFDLLINDLNLAALALASSLPQGTVQDASIRRLVHVPRTMPADWDYVAGRMNAL